MNAIEDALEWDDDLPAPAKGQRGTLGDWMPFVNGTIKGAVIQLVERRIVGPADEGVSIPISPGTAVVVEVRVAAFGRERRVAALRVRPVDVPVSRGERLGTIDVDIGGVAVCDRDVMAAWQARNHDSWDEWSGFVANDYIEHGDEVGLIPCEPLGVAIPYVDGGFGDGSYPVFALHAANRAEPVGLECEFLAPDATYPFDAKDDEPDGED